MKKSLQLVAVEIYDNLNGLSNGWSSNPTYQSLNYWDKVKVDRIINNLIREDYY